MRIAVAAADSPLRKAIVGAISADPALRLAGEDQPAECAISLTPEQLPRALKTAGLQRLVQRSTAFAYGASDKNPGMMTEERVSLLSPKSPAQKWLRAEEAALQFSNAAVLRLSNVLAPEEGDLIVRQISGPIGFNLAGFDPNVQFISIEDAARAFVSAARSNATGIFNITGPGAIPLYKAFRATGTERVPVPGGVHMNPMQFNWTVSGERAARELDFIPRLSTVQALREFALGKGGANQELLSRTYDNFGLDVDFIKAWGDWFTFVSRVYWRVETEGYENFPATGRAMFVSNHRGFMPLDAVIHLYLTMWNTGRIIRFLIIPSLLRTPYLCNFLTKLGGVIANQVNAERLFAAEDLVGVFPEGIRGSFTPYRKTYQLRDFSKSAFAKLAIENQVPIVPVAVIGHSEIFPILARIDSSWVTKELGWPYLPIAPMFPLAPVPLPSKWHIRVLKPVPVDGLNRSDAENARLVKEFSRYIQSIVQCNIDDMRPKRKSWFWGRIFDGTAPDIQPFQLPRAAKA
jgi:1-acyl-sn-glycerol-3-phosphate acyltransferase